MIANPFVIDDESEYVDAQSRLDCVKEFSELELRGALEVRGLQKSVRVAIERRLKRLNAEKSKESA